MKVAFISPRYYPNVAGGGEVSLKLLAENLSEHDSIDKVSVFSFDGTSLETINGVTVHRLGNAFELPEYSNPVCYSKLKGVLSEYDLVHSYNMEYHPAAGALAERLSIPAVATLNSYTYLPKREMGMETTTKELLYEKVFLPFTGRILIKYIEKIDKFITLSEASKQIYDSQRGPYHDITVIPNLIDTELSAYRDYSPDGEETILYVGSLKKIKGVRYLIEALAHLPSRFRLRIVGDGPEMDNLVRLANSRNLDSRIDFVGSIPYRLIDEQYERADIFVHPGVWVEPFGRTIVEAIQSGLPVVTTNIGGPSEIVSIPELRCEPRDPSSLAASIEWASEHSDEVIKDLQQTVESRYAPSVVVPRVVDLYADACANYSSGPSHSGGRLVKN